MYCTISDVRNILPESIRIGDNNIGTPIPTNTSASRDILTTDKVLHFIRKAQEEIDSRLRNQFICPLRRIKSFETAIHSDAKAGNNVLIDIHDTTPFNKGDKVRLQSSDYIEEVTIAEIVSQSRLKITTIESNFLASDYSLISLISLPSPIPLIAARLAAAMGYDSVFTNDNSPNVSAYGNTQRQLAFDELDGILDGSIKLQGQELSGYRFKRGSIADPYKTPVKEFQFGRNKPSST